MDGLLLQKKVEPKIAFTQTRDSQTLRDIKNPPLELIESEENTIKLNCLPFLSLLGRFRNPNWASLLHVTRRYAKE